MFKDLIKTAIESFQSNDLLASSTSLYNSLGFKFDAIAQGNENLVLDKIDNKHKTSFQETRLLFQFDKTMLSQPSFDENSHDKFNNLLFVAISLGDKEYFNKSKLANMVRALNRSGWPIVALFYNKDKLSIGLTELRKHKRDNDKWVAEKVTLIRDIDIASPHVGHISILNDCFAIDKKVASLDDLHKYWQEKLSQELLTKQFYNELKDWYEYARTKITVPLTPQAIKKNISEDTYKAESLIRLITRLIFVWFLREAKDSSSREGLVNDDLFNEDILKELNTDKDPSSYYKVVLQNLFFAVLNTKDPSINDLRHHNLFKNGVGEFFGKYLKQTPFLNGGLFMPLLSKDNDGLWDDYFTDGNNDLHMGNELFFGNDGFYKILEQYKFTISENSSIDNEIALDPELLGKVFEELLSSYVDEVSGDKNDKKKNTGSYYTPREVVDYMVGESLYSTVKDIISTEEQEQDFKAILKGNYQETSSFSSDDKEKLWERLKSLKIIDPACGSGAFPMGILLALDNAISYLKNDGKADYDRKLEIIKNNVYGVDIQPIAIQISKLRFFISLLCSEDFSKELEPLPNLETKLVVANTLNKIDLSGLAYSIVSDTMKDIIVVRNKHVEAHNVEKKTRLRDEDIALCRQMKTKLEEAGFAKTEDKLSEVSNWSPYKIDQSADFFDPKIMFGLDNFDLVIGNPPYGAKLSDPEKKLYQKIYTTTSTRGGLKGSIDTFAIFTERALGLINKDTWATLNFIVPLSITSSDSMQQLHKHIFNNCEEVKISSYFRRPAKIFATAGISTSIILMRKGKNKLSKLMMTKTNKRNANKKLEDVFKGLSFVDCYELNSQYPFAGRLPRLSYKIELDIMSKLHKHKKLEHSLQPSGSYVYYRKSGGEYYKLITNFSTESSEENNIYVSAQHANIVCAVLCSTLYYWWFHAYSDVYHIKTDDLTQFPLDPTLFTADEEAKLDTLVARHMQRLQDTKEQRPNHVEYYARHSKADILDEIDRTIGRAYGLTDEEVEFIINYDIEYRK